jgi:hypothetical protein
VETYWDKNSAILHNQYPGLLEAIEAENDDPGESDINIEAAAGGAPTLKIGGTYVHSPRDPEREGRRLAEACLAETDSPGPVVVLGFGLGYAAQSLAELEPGRPIIIVEKRLGLLRKAFELKDLSRLLSRPGVAFIPGGTGEGIINALSVFEKIAGERAVPYVMRNRTLMTLDEEWYAAAEGRVRAWAMRDDVNMATLKRFGRRWINNLSRNMTFIRDLPGISRLGGLAEAEDASPPLPVFLAAAGPGLDGIAPLLPEIHQRCIIVAVDTSLRFLLRNGVDPDFVVVVDPQYWNSRHLNRCECSHTRLIAESAVYPPVLRLPFKEQYLCGSLFPLGAFIEQRVDPKGALGAGGSVATSAWDFSRILGAKEIWIAGLDLAFPGLKTHFRGAEFEEKALAETGRRKPAETWLTHALRDGFPFVAPSMGGGQVLTDRRLSLYAAWFENNFRRFPEIRNYCLMIGGGTEESSHQGGRATSGGLAIAGFEPAGAEVLLALPERRNEIDQRLEAAFTRIETDFFEPETAQLRHTRYQNAVTTLVSGLEQIKTACKKGEKIAVQALRQDFNQKNREKTLASLDEINRFIAASEVKEIAGFLFPAETVETPHPAPSGVAKQGSNDNTFRQYLEYSLNLYRSLADSATLPFVTSG